MRSAEPDASVALGWRVANAWVKQGILLGFRIGKTEAMASEGGLAYVDKNTFRPRRYGPEDGVRVVPGGSSVRGGAFIAQGVIMAPPSFVDVGGVCR